MENAVWGERLIVIIFIIFDKPRPLFSWALLLKVSAYSKAKTLFREEGWLIEQNGAELLKKQDDASWKVTVAGCGIQQRSTPRSPGGV